MTGKSSRPPGAAPGPAPGARAGAQGTITVLAIEREAVAPERPQDAVFRVRFQRGSFVYECPLGFSAMMFEPGDQTVPLIKMAQLRELAGDAASLIARRVNDCLNRGEDPAGLCPFEVEDAVATSPPRAGPAHGPGRGKGST